MRRVRPTSSSALASSRLVRACVCGLTVAALGGGCSLQVDPERNSEDSYRTNAMEMPLNRVIIDNLTSYGGDQTDWKIFTVPAEGLVKVTIKFDNEESIPKVKLINDVGRPIAELLPPKNGSIRQFTFEAKPNFYYLYMTVVDGSTDYSLEVTHTLLPE